MSTSAHGTTEHVAGPYVGPPAIPTKDVHGATLGERQP